MIDANTQSATKQAYRAERAGNAVYLKKWQRVGSGQLCSGCSKRIELNETEIEIELPPELKSASARFHVDCFRVWSGEADPEVPATR